MKPIRTAETTTMLQPAPGDEERVEPLPSYIEGDAIVSIWEPEAQELEDMGLRIGGAAVGGWRRFGVRLEVLGDSPPVRLSIVTLHETPTPPAMPVYVVAPQYARRIFEPGDADHPAEQIRRVVDDEHEADPA